jgi:SpoIID/LytB domain protein
VHNRQILRRALLGAVAVLTAGLPSPASAAASSAASASSAAMVATPSTLFVHGRGFGHGRGAGQYGSLGYAIDHGWSTNQILGHFYGGTTAGNVSTTSLMTVRLLGLDGQPLRATITSGSVGVVAPGGGVVGLRQAARVRLSGTDLVVEDAGSCAGPWTQRLTFPATSTVRLLPVTSSTSPSIPYGTTGDVAVTGDWDGDGDDTLGVFRPSNRTFYLRNSNTPGPAQLAVAFGTSGDLPIVGDWDGDGDDTVGVFRPSARRFYFRNTNTSGPATQTVLYGSPGDVPVVGDWDGDGDTTLGVRRGGTWYLRNDLLPGPATIASTYGLATDLPVVGNWDGAGGDGIGVRRGSTFYLRNSPSGGSSDAVFAYGPSGAQPVGGSWDGVGGDTVGSYAASAFSLATANGAPAAPVSLIGQPLDRTLQVCEGTNARRWYRGELRATSTSGSQRTVNAVPIDEYVRGVVPQESPPSWGSLGCSNGTCSGARALEVQAVAARSYSLAENRYPYAKTCDTIACQVYRGRRAVSEGGTVTTYEHALTDAATSATAGVVRMAAGTVARTEFSSSTGGWTAGGTFPSVPDEGDDVSLNPNHRWTAGLARTAVEASYASGTLSSVRVTARTAADGGRRVQTIQLVFSGGTVNESGDAFRSRFGLRSTWFTPFFGRAETFGVRRDPQTWFLRYAMSTGPSNDSFAYGPSGGAALAGDFDGNGLSGIGVRAGETWYLKQSPGPGLADIVLDYGLASDLPVVGDWDGDGDDTPGVYRNGTWFLRNTASGGVSDIVFAFGGAGDIPVVGDWDGDGIDGVGVLDGDTFRLRDDLAPGAADRTIDTGITGDVPIAADWNGDGIATVALYHDVTGTLRWWSSNATGAPTSTMAFGTTGDHPVAGAWVL